MSRTTENDINMRKAVNDALVSYNVGDFESFRMKVNNLWELYFSNSEASSLEEDILSTLVNLLNLLKIELLDVVAKELVRIRIKYVLPEGDTHFTAFVNDGSYQQQHREICYKYIKKWDVAIDIGGHVGFWANSLSSRFSAVHSFEPNPNTFKCLIKNKCRNVTAYNFGLGAKKDKKFLTHPEQATISDLPQNSGNWEMHDEDLEGTYPVMITTLDSLDLKPDFIKIDVQGFELHVLKGGRKTIKKYKPVMCIECVCHGIVNHDVIKYAKEELGMVIKETYIKEYIFGWPE